MFLMFTGLSANISATLNRMMNMKKKHDKIRENHIRELISNIEQSKAEMKLAMDNFNNVTEPKLIDFYIYKIQSEQTRYEQLLSEYKELYRSTDEMTTK